MRLIRTLRSLITRRKTRLTAALPAFVIALLYYRALEDQVVFPGVSWRDLVTLLQVEGLVIHSFCFLGFIWIALARRRGFWPLEVVFWLLAALYFGVSLNYGAKGPLYFIAATLATYPVFFFPRQVEPTKERNFTQVLYNIHPQAPPKSRFPKMDGLSVQTLVFRWALCFILYFGLFVLFGLPNNVDRWQTTSAVFRMGTAYFFTLGLLEAVGFYEVEKWKMLLAKFQKQHFQGRTHVLDHPGGGPARSGPWHRLGCAFRPRHPLPRFETSRQRQTRGNKVAPHGR